MSSALTKLSPLFIPYFVVFLLYMDWLHLHLNEKLFVSDLYHSCFLVSILAFQATTKIDITTDYIYIFDSKLWVFSVLESLT